MQFDLQGIPTEYQLNEESDKLTDIVQGSIQLNTNETYAIEKQAAISIGYISANAAWNAVLVYNGSQSNYPGKTFDNVGWVRGVQNAEGGWGAYLWVLQNRIAFQSSTSEWWSTTNGIPVAITNVIVGSLGDYGPMSNVVDIGPHLDAATNNFPGANMHGEEKEYQVDITNVFYELVIPDIWITPRSVVTNVGGSDIQYSVVGTNIPSGVNWTLIPDLSSSSGAVIQASNDWHYAGVTPGNVATNYKVRATSVDNTNFYDQVDLAVRKVDIVETNIYIAVSNTITLHLTADSTPDAEWEIMPDLQSGAYIEGSDSGTSIVFNAGSIPTNYTVKAYAEDLTNCYDTCTVTVIKVEIEKCGSGFLPQGGTNDNTTTIRSFVTPATIKGTFKFTMFDVSNEKGYCLNAPTNLPASGEDSDAWKDFQFPSQTGFTISGTDSNIAETVSNDLNEATITVKSFDYGSFGKIKAEFMTQDGNLTCVAREVNGTNEYTCLPADTNGNCIADSWGGDTGLGTSKEALDDTDSIPAGDGADGDQLSRYQEYRGFVVQGAHVRTDPTQKDVFCRNHNVEAAGLSGFLTTANLGAPVYAINSNEWVNDSRRINQMSETYTLSPDLQTAIKVEDAGCGEGSWGETLCTAEPWVPNRLEYCLVDVAKIQDSGTSLSAPIDSSSNTIPVSSADDYRGSGAIKIDAEIILYSSKTTTVFTGCTRGAMGTSAVSHNNGASVGNFANADEAIQAVFGHEAGHVIGLEDFYGTNDNHIMNGTLERGSYLNNGYWSTYTPALTNEFRVKP